MLAGLDAFTSTFLLDLNNTENQISKTNQHLSSGYRVNEASDDPVDISAILNDQNQISQITQVQTNLNTASTSASSADTALSTTTSLLNQLASIASQGASSTSTAATRTTLGQQVQGIEQQLVGLANTQIQGTYIFGGDNAATQTYTYDSTAPEGVTQINTSANTTTIQDISGQTIVPAMTAQQIFDARNADGTPATGNVFGAAYSLAQALLSNSQTDVQAATSLVSAASTQVSQATTFYGGVEDWIQNASSIATSTLTNVQAEVGNLRDTDVAAAATDLTTEQTAMQAALAAQGSLSVKSLFDYMG